MTSISSSYSTSYSQSPALKTLQSMLSSGEISSTDGDALTTALSSIDETLKSERSSSTSTTEPPSPEEMQEKISDLIQSQVDAGTITSEQAEELSDVFEQTFANGPGGPGGAGGPPPGPPPSGSESESDDSSTSSTSSTSMDDFIKQLQAMLTSSSSYSSGGETTSSTTAGYVLDLVA